MNMTHKQKQEFKKVLQEIEDPKNIGQGSWDLPENSTPSERVKFEICQKILRYQRKNNLSDKVIARKTHLTISETEDILFCRISKFTLDNLLNYASQLFAPCQVEVNIKDNKNIHVRVV
jgi:predicted XRE-type DNA-binding protein